MPTSGSIVKVRAIAGATLKLSLKTPWSLSGYEVTSQVKDSGTDELLGEFSVQVVTPVDSDVIGDRIDLSLPHTATANAEAETDKYVFDVRLVAPNGEVTYTPKVRLVFSERVTHEA